MKNITAKKFNSFLFFKLPSAYWLGIRLKELTEKKATSSVKYKWINKNPFKSMYFAVQSMAAEISTGALVAKKTFEQEKTFSMLVLSHQGNFTKKATGRLFFSCEDGALVDQSIQKAIKTNTPQLITMKSIGKNTANEIVSEYTFVWSIKIK